VDNGKFVHIPHATLGKEWIENLSRTIEFVTTLLFLLILRKLSRILSRSRKNLNKNLKKTKLSISRKCRSLPL
jgi:hypothetical protein